MITNYEASYTNITRITILSIYQQLTQHTYHHTTLHTTGIDDALRKAGANEGDLVMIGEWDFSYSPKRKKWMTDMGLNEILPTHSRPAYMDDEYKPHQPYVKKYPGFNKK